MFNPPLPLTPLCPHDEAEQNEMDSLQRQRVAALSSGRVSDPSVTWRYLLLGKNREKQARLVQAMRDAELPESVVQRTEACAAHVFVYRNVHTNEHRLRHYTCHNRFCLMCQGSYLRQVKERALAIVPEAQHHLSFLTLTQRARPGRELSRAIASITSSFRTMRRAPGWRSRVPGGLYVIEVTTGTRGWWHAHLHAVIDTKWWPLEDLNTLWHQASHDIVHCQIEVVKGGRQHHINRYLSKYLTKAFSDDLYNHPEILAQFVATCRGRRLIQAFGAWSPKAASVA